MKKFVLLNVAFALNLFVAHNTLAALPQGLESVNVRATLNIQNVNSKSVKTMSFSNRDILTIIQNQFGVAIPNGSQLVMRGLGAPLTNQFAVWSPSARTNVIANASSDGITPYALYFMPDYNRLVVNQRGSVNNFTFSQADLHYNNAANTASFDLFGLTTATVNIANNNESFTMRSGAGPFMLIPGGGVITGSMNGSGRNVAVPFTLPTPPI